MDDRTLEDKLEAVLDSLRKRSPDPLAIPPSRTGGCLDFGRVRALVLDPSRTTPADEAHLRECRRCGVLLATFEREQPHLSIWELLGDLLGQRSEAASHTLQYHLELGGCRACRARLERLRQGPLSLLQLPPPLPLIPANVVRAATPGPKVLTRAQGEGLEAELAQFRGELSLELKTRQSELGISLVTYAFRDSEGEVLLDGYVVLAADVEGWYAAEVTLDADLYHERVGERCTDLSIGVVQPDALSEAEWRRLSEVALNDHTKETTRAAWRDWCVRTLLAGDALPAPARSILEALLARLGR